MRNFGYFYDLAQRQGFHCWHSVRERRRWWESEYLVDLIWWTGYDFQDDKEGDVPNPEDWGKHKRAILLAMEHELQPKQDAIYFAFCKLIDVKAYLKVFICTPPEWLRSTLPIHLARLVSRSKIKISIEMYLLMIFSRRGNGLCIEGFAIDHQGNGTKLKPDGCFPDRLVTR